MEDFDIDKLFPEEQEENLTPYVQKVPAAKKLSPKDLRDSVLRVFYRLGGDGWLLEQAKINPDEFIKMLKVVIPREQPSKADAQPLQINIINNYNIKGEPIDATNVEFEVKNEDNDTAQIPAEAIPTAFIEYDSDKEGQSDDSMASSSREGQSLLESHNKRGG